MTTQYADYTFYTNTFLGVVITVEADFDRFALRASAVLDRLSFERVAVVITAGTDTDLIALIKMAVCAMADVLARAEDSGDVGGIQQEKVGQHSVTYARNSEASQSITMRMKDEAELYLASSELLYRGFAEDEYSALG